MTAFCNVQIVTRKRPCGMRNAEPFTAICRCGHPIAGLACRRCRQSVDPGCLTCWNGEDRHRCPVTFLPENVAAITGLARERREKLAAGITAARQALPGDPQAAAAAVTAKIQTITGHQTEIVTCWRCLGDIDIRVARREGLQWSHRYDDDGACNETAAREQQL